ncbi:ADP-ribosylglycohydrolase family protein [Chitinophaga silvatica]|uniref:ADP-ribosylglycohydrolase family protein n=1 Tax=Chitinophaga silvatica TaxID=2282649 RepID=A0A3E1Y6B6_9BACT|nr:ADP-ribosylglycohydrolase family protein [Chitinophaga silvatica]RFS20242.1 ADP-ribosylglycohydrolase family protein [Chitinophaga silvatica]
MNINTIKSAFLGLAVGDALGVPVEFLRREVLKKSPVTEMRGFGTHTQPPGTWSDDSSLTFCLAAALTKGYDLQRLANYFTDWLYRNFWTPHGEIFDVGIATRQAIWRLKMGDIPILAGGNHESDNGNGSLMRILPLVFYMHNKSISERFYITKDVSSLTHRHIRSVIGCFYYLEFARELLNGTDKFKAYFNLQQQLLPFLQTQEIQEAELEKLNSLWKGDISLLDESLIRSSGYVLHTLEASIWCILTTSSYSEAVLKAVNLGEDTDTTGAVTGGLAGIIYGMEGIPSEWIDVLARKNDIEKLINEFGRSL